MYYVGNTWRQCLAPFPVFLDHGEGIEVGSSHLVWFVIQLAITTQNIMHIFTCRPKLWWYAPVASLDSTICDAWKTYKDFEFSVAAILKILNGGYHKNQVMYPHICYDLLHSWSPINAFSCKYSYVDQSYNHFKFSVAAILKMLNGGYHKNQVICPHILYDLLHSWSSIHKMSCKYSHVDQSYSNFEFRWRPFWKIIMEAITRIRWYILKFGMICYTAGHEYTKFHANIHM